jgi:cytochrome c oxidase subunit 1
MARSRGLGDVYKRQGLEWEVASPAPFHTFEVPPKLNEDATKVIA